MKKQYQIPETAVFHIGYSQPLLTNSILIKGQDAVDEGGFYSESRELLGLPGDITNIIFEP